MTPWNDFIWKQTWEIFLKNQREIGNKYIVSVADDLRLRLGLPIPSGERFISAMARQELQRQLKPVVKFKNFATLED